MVSLFCVVCFSGLWDLVGYVKRKRNLEDALPALGDLLTLYVDVVGSALPCCLSAPGLAARFGVLPESLCAGLSTTMAPEALQSYLRAHSSGDTRCLCVGVSRPNCPTGA